MAGYFKNVLTPWDTQPPSLVEVHSDYAHLVRSVRQWNIPATIPVECSLRGLDGFAKTGTIDVSASPAGVGVKGDGSTGLYSRTVAVVPQAMWMAAQFICNSSTITQKTAYGLGSGAASGGTFCGIFSGNSTTSAFIVQLRAVDAGPVIGKLGPTPVVGTTYNVVAVFPSELKADAYLYVNGIKYTADFSSSADISFVGPTTLVNECVGALKRGTTAVYSSDTVLFTARGLGQIPEALAKQISLNPYSLLQPDERRVWVSTSAAPTVVTLDPVAFDFVPQNIQNTASATLTASALNLTGEALQNSITNNLTAPTFDFVAQDITAENAGAATVTLDTATFDFVANDSQNTLRTELSTATFDFVQNDVQTLLAHSLDVATFDFVQNDAQFAVSVLFSEATLNFTANSITFPGLPSTGRATNMMLMGVGN